MKTHILMILAFVLVLPLSAAPILVNGGFESGSGSASGSLGTFLRCTSAGVCGATPGGITGWTISGDVDYIQSLWTAAEGARSVDLAGGPKTGGSTGVSQTFSTVAGQEYLVSFYLAGNPDGTPTIKSLVIGAEGQTGNFTFDTTGLGHTNMNWVLRTWLFTAQDSSATLSFTTTDSDYGPAIDNVGVEVVPEPASMLLLGTGILALAGLGRFLRKR